VGHTKSHTSDFRRLASVLARRVRGKDVVGFDLFDTLLRRRVEPETVKDLVARELARQLDAPDWAALRQRRRELELELGQASERRGNDHEFRLAEMMWQWVAEATGDRDIGNLPERMVRHELELEKAATFPTPGILKVLKALRAAGRRIIFVSDIYLDIESLWELLACHGLADCFDGGYVSSSEFKTKSSGRLLESVLQQEGIEPAKLLFVGDNPHSDVVVPNRMGIDTVLIRDDEEYKRRLRLRTLERLSADNRYWCGRLAREIVEVGARHIQEDPSPHYRLGLLLAPALVTFTLHVLQEAQRQGLQRLFFLSREGLTFLKMYRRLVRAMGLGEAAPPGVYLGTSRIATFMPSMAELSLPELFRMWDQYDRQSIRVLLRNLNLPGEVFLPLAERCGIADPDAPVEDPHADAAFQRFLHDPEVQGAFTSCRDEVRGLMESYLRDKGMFGLKRVGIVDIGWKGSIQENIARTFAGRDDFPMLEGLYFAHYESGEPVPGSRLTGFFADTSRVHWTEEVVFRNGPVFEMFTSAPHGSVLTYARRASDGRAKPIIKPSDVERQNYAAYARLAMQAVEDYLCDFLRVQSLIDVDAEDLKPYVLDQLRRYILYPTAEEARSFLDYSHLENFGMHTVSTYGFKGSWQDILLGGPITDVRRRLTDSLDRQFWPEGILKRSRVPFANLLFDLVQTEYACNTYGLQDPTGSDTP